MLYPKEDKENRILLYAVSAAPRVFRDRPLVPNVAPPRCRPDPSWSKRQSVPQMN